MARQRMLADAAEGYNRTHGQRSTPVLHHSRQLYNAAYSESII